MLSVDLSYLRVRDKKERVTECHSLDDYQCWNLTTSTRVCKATFFSACLLRLPHCAPDLRVA